MAFRKCPKCELNYILDDQPYCVVCMQGLKGLNHHDEDGELCPICGEREPAPGEEYCAECLVEMKKLDRKQSPKEEEEDDEPAEEEEENIVAIEEIADLPIGDEEEAAVPPFELESINEELAGEDEALFEEEDTGDGEEEDDEKEADDA